MEFAKETALGLILPFLGTALGSLCVFVLKKNMGETTQRILTGFAAGVMVAASIWSLLIPSISQSESMGRLAFMPAAIGFCAGMGFILILDSLIPHLHLDSDEPEGLASSFKKINMLALAVTIHNLPEGMAVGIAIAGWKYGNMGISFSAAMALSIGIAIQNFPEGAIISMPMYANGNSKKKSFIYGLLSGAVEPIAGLITILLAGVIVYAMPYLLSFAAGAMMYVVVEELIPEMSKGRHSNSGVVSFSLGFVLMMILDVALG